MFTYNGQTGEFKALERITIDGKSVGRGDTLYRVDKDTKQHPDVYGVETVGVWDDDTQVFGISTPVGIQLISADDKSFFATREAADEKIRYYQELRTRPMTTMTISVPQDIITRAYARLNKDSRQDHFKEIGNDDTRSGLIEFLLQAYADGEV